MRSPEEHRKIVEDLACKQRQASEKQRNSNTQKRSKKRAKRSTAKKKAIKMRVYSLQRFARE